MVTFSGRDLVSQSQVDEANATLAFLGVNARITCFGEKREVCFNHLKLNLASDEDRIKFDFNPKRGWWISKARATSYLFGQPGIVT